MLSTPPCRRARSSALVEAGSTGIGGDRFAPLNGANVQADAACQLWLRMERRWRATPEWYERHGLIDDRALHSPHAVTIPGAGRGTVTAHQRPRLPYASWGAGARDRLGGRWIRRSSAAWRNTLAGKVKGPPPPRSDGKTRTFSARRRSAERGGGGGSSVQYASPSLPQETLEAIGREGARRLLSRADRRGHGRFPFQER